MPTSRTPTSRPALLVIDVQRALCEGEYQAHDADGLVLRIRDLARAARAAGALVVFIQHESRDGILDVGTEGWQLAPGLGVDPGDTLVRKTTPDSFLRTDLGPLLERQGIDRLVICGLQSEYCVDTTTRRALALGYPVDLVCDAHSTLDTEHLSAAQITRHHNATLSSISSFGVRATLTASRDVAF